MTLLSFPLIALIETLTFLSPPWMSPVVGCPEAAAVGAEEPGAAAAAAAGYPGPFGCRVREVLLCCLPTLTQEALAARLALAQRLEQTALTLNTATAHHTGG